MDSDCQGTDGGGRRAGARPTALPGSVAEIFAGYQEEITHPDMRLEAATVRVYASRVRQYLAWLAVVADGTAQGDPLNDAAARDRAVSAYRAHLQAVVKRKPATINAHLTAVDDFYRRRGLGPAASERAGIAPAAPRALDKRDQIRLLREADRAPLRDKAIACTAFYAGTRINEIARLDTADVRLSPGGGQLTVGHGHNGRDVPLHPKLRAVLEEWIGERATWKGAGTSSALFLNHRGSRLSVRSAYTVLRTIAGAANLSIGRDGVFTPRVLRSTAGAAMTSSGADIVAVAQLLGQSVETTRRYREPTSLDLQKAIEGLTVEE